MLDTVLADTRGKLDPTTKAGRGVVSGGPEPGNAINRGGWENGYGRDGNKLFVAKGAIADDCLGSVASQNNCELEGWTEEVTGSDGDTAGSEHGLMEGGGTDDDIGRGWDAVNNDATSKVRRLLGQQMQEAAKLGL